MRFSVIVPVYNVAEYLGKCLDSLMPALQDEDEIILSLSISKDESNRIAIEYDKQYTNIKIVEQNGKGLSNARNCAINAAIGDYIICVDSDDYVKTEILRDFLARIRYENWQDDVIVHDYYRFERQSGKIIEYFQVGNGVEASGLAFMPQMLSKRQCFWNVWRYIYRRDFLKKNGIVYLENIMSEDVAYTTDVLLTKPKIRFVHYPYYVYTVGRGDSLMDKPTVKRVSDTVSVLQYAVKRLRGSDLDVRNYLTAQFQFEYLLNMALIYEIDQVDKKTVIKLFADWRAVLSESSDKMIGCCRMVLHIFGVRLFGLFMYILKKVRRLLRRLK